MLISVIFSISNTFKRKYILVHRTLSIMNKMWIGWTFSFIMAAHDWQPSMCGKLHVPGILLVGKDHLLSHTLRNCTSSFLVFLQLGTIMGPRTVTKEKKAVGASHLSSFVSYCDDSNYNWKVPFLKQKWGQSKVNHSQVAGSGSCVSSD